MGLTFVSPALLAGIALVAVPIVLHLVMRRQPKHFIFPALRFLQQRQQANRRQLRLRHLVLLALRCAAIVLLAAALARPSIKTEGVLGNQEAPVAAALVFDTAPRMQYRQENHTRLEAAQEMAGWLLTQLPAESDVAVLDVNNPTGIFAADLGAAEQRIKNLKIGALGTPLTQVIEQTLRLVGGNEKTRKEIYVFTDLSRGAWPTEAGPLKARLEAANNVALYVIDVGVAQPRNFALGDVKVTPEILAKNSKVRLETDLLRVGPDEERGVAVYLLDDAGKPQLRDQQTHKWHAGEAESADFTIGGESIGTHQGFVRILGEDNLAADDIRYFTFDVRPPFRVLVAAPKPADRYALFLTEALAPARFRQSGQARFECDTIALDQLADRDLESYAAVCLLDPTPLDAAVWERLRTYVDQGGGLGVWLGRNAEPVSAFTGPEASALLPGKLAIRAHAGPQDVYLAPRDLEHPLMAKFRPLGTSVPWSAFRVWEHWTLADLARDKSAVVVIPYSDGQPALIDKQVGRGRVLTMTTPVSDAASDPNAWNELPTGDRPWPFVMLSNEMLLYLAHSGEERLNYMIGDRAVLRLDENQTQTDYSLLTPRKDEGTVTLKADLAQRTVVVQDTGVAGNYSIAAGGSVGGVRRGFSVNIPLAATQLERITPETLNDLLGAGRFRLAHNREEIDRNVSMGRTGRELYPFLIFLVALALGLEYLLGNRFYRRAATPEPHVPKDVEKNPPPNPSPSLATAAK